MPSRRLILSLSAGALAVVLAAVGYSQLSRPDTTRLGAIEPPAASVAPSASASSPAPQVSLSAAPAPNPLPTLSYFSAAKNLPADSDPMSVTPITQGLKPDKSLIVYDAPGGTPRAMLPADISGMPVTVPIVSQQSGWVAVLLPTMDRTIGWLAPTGWTAATLHDQIIVHVAAHQLIWLEDGVVKATFTVATGAPDTPTPLGRTYVMGRTATEGKVYAGVDALVLGAIPENKGALAESLRDGHTAIHGWYKASAFGHSVSNGCVRMSAAHQTVLLDNIPPGTVVHIVAT